MRLDAVSSDFEVDGLATLSCKSISAGTGDFRRMALGDPCDGLRVRFLRVVLRTVAALSTL